MSYRLIDANALAKLPCIYVDLPDGLDGGYYATTDGGGECELVEVDSYNGEKETIHVLECSACGKTCEHVNGSYPKCPHCGKDAVKR